MVCDTVITYTWSSLDADVASLKQQIIQSDFKPNLVVGLLRGGAIPAVMLSHQLKTPMEALQWSKRDFSSRHFGHYIDHILKSAIRDSQRVLIVDDILDSGETIGELQHYASKMTSIKMWKQYIKFACLWKNVSCDVPIDYHVKEVDRKEDQRWVVFPWE